MAPSGCKQRPPVVAPHLLLRARVCKLNAGCCSVPSVFKGVKPILMAVLCALHVWLLTLQGSECTMLCNDFARLGYDYVVVDAGVQLTYDWNLAREMMACECIREGKTCRREGEGGRGGVWVCGKE